MAGGNGVEKPAEGPVGEGGSDRVRAATDGAGAVGTRAPRAGEAG